MRRWLIFAFVGVLFGFLSILIFTVKEAQAQTLDTPSAPVSSDAPQTLQQPVQDTTQPVTETAQPAQKTSQPVTDTAQDTAQPVQETTQPVTDTAQETAQPVVAPVVETAQPVVAPVVETARPVVAPIVETAQPVVSPIVDTAQLVVAPVVETAQPVVNPVVETAQPVVDPTVRTSVPQPAPVIGTLQQPENPLASPSVSLSFAPRALDSASSLGAGGSTLVAPQRNLVELSSSSYGSAGVLNSYSALVSHSLLSGLISSLSFGGVEDLLNQTPQPFSPGVPPASGSSSGSSSGYGGGNGLLGILALLSLLLLGGKFLWARREFLKPSSALLPIIERPG